MEIGHMVIKHTKDSRSPAKKSNDREAIFPARIR